MATETQATPEPPTRPSRGSTSQTLLDRVRLGRDEDRQLLMTLYWPVVVDIYIRHDVVTEEDDRRTIGEKVFRTVFRRIESQGFVRKRRGAFRAWLERITRNKVGDFIRREQRRGRRFELSQPWDQLPDLLNGESDDTDQENAAMCLIVRQALEIVRAEFEPTTFAMAHLQLVDGHTGHEAGEAHGRTQNAAHVAKHRVKKRLRQVIENFEPWSDD